jgi:hypothetical protein
MNVRTALAALVLIVAVLAAVMMLLVDEGGTPTNEAGPVLSVPDPSSTATDMAPAGGSAEPVAADASRLVVEAPPVDLLSARPADLLATGVVSGRLVDSRGQPISGEPVDLLASDDAWWTVMRRDEQPDVVDRGFSDNQGRFVLAARAGAMQELRAGGLRWTRVIGVTVSAGDEVELELGVGQALEGMVIDQETGVPVEGAWVGSFSGVDKLLARTDRRGLFSLTPLPDEVVLVGAFFEGYDIGVHEPVAPGWGRIVIELPPGRVIDGRVYDRKSDLPVVGAAVVVAILNEAHEAGLPDPFEGKRTIEEWTAVTDAEGRFSIDGCPSSQFRVEVKADGYLLSRSDRYVERSLGEEDVLAIGLAPVEALTGRVVVGTDGVPAMGARVELREPDGHVVSALADSEGRFSLDLTNWSGRGPVIVAAVDDQGRHASHRVRKRSDKEIELSLVGPLMLEVLVTAPSGPVEGAQVVITSNEVEPTLAMTDASGRARLLHPLGGADVKKAVVQARYGAAQSVPKVLPLKDGPPAGPLLLDLSEGAWYAGLVQDIFGAPLPHALVVVRNGGFDRADAEGRFDVGPVDIEAGKAVTLLAQAKGFRPTSLKDVYPNQNVVLTLDPVVTWRGRVSDATTGDPLTVFNGRVLVETFDEGKLVWRRGAATRLAGPAGEFSVELEEAGTLKLEIRAPDSLAAQSLPEVFDGLNPPPWVDMFLGKAAVLKVFVTGSNGSPVSGYSVAIVKAERAGDSSAPSGKLRKQSRSARTGSDGHASFNLGEGGRYRLASGPGRWLDEQELLVLPGPPTEHYLRVGGTGGVSLLVRDLQGEFVANVKASVRSVGGDHVHSVKHRLADSADDESLYTKGLPEGRYKLDFGKRGYRKASEEVIVTAGRLQHVDAVLELIPAPKDLAGAKEAADRGSKSDKKKDGKKKDGKNKDS